MAVSFKVPKSPKRSIFVIDEFMGVDLTNSGANIEETRSPNAENMVRNVPGKVRKRTGYKTKITISDGTDVNRALGTSDEWIEVPCDGTRVEFEIATDDEPITAPYYEVVMYGIGTFHFGFTCVDGYDDYKTRTGTDEAPYDDDFWSYAQRDYSSHGGIKKFYIENVSNDPDDVLRVKQLRLFRKTSYSFDDFETKALWKAAPEDNGGIFKLESTTPPIWGFHKLRAGVFDGNRVVNVNRALATSDSFVTYTLTPNRYEAIYGIANAIYGDSTRKTPMYVEFDYISDASVFVRIAGTVSSGAWMENTSGLAKHFSGMIEAGEPGYASTVSFWSSTAANVQIKNFSLMYEKNDLYQWSAAPEDVGEEFHESDVYNIKSKNYATIDNYSISTNQPFEDITIADSSLSDVRYYKVSFDLYFSTDRGASSINVYPCYRTGGTNYYATSWETEYPPFVSNTHVEFYVSFGTGRYVNDIRVTLNGTLTTGTSDIKLSNIMVQECTGKESYDISSKNYIYHAGSKFYLRASNSNKLVEIYSNANQHLSQSWQLNEKLFILDGQNIYQYSIGDESVQVINTEGGYIPLVTISKFPDGGGNSYESLNMLQPGFYEQFLVDSSHASEKNFHLSFNSLDSTTTKAWLLDQYGNWVEKTEGTDYTVDRSAGIIKFLTAPGATPLTGEDNVKILAYRTVPGYSDRVAKCTTGTLFGVGGAADRLFLTGNPDYPNWDFYSQDYDPTYFPDTGYSQLGSAASAIVGYAIVNNYLATFKDDFDNSQAVFIREGDLVVNNDTGTSEPAFRLINTLQGNGVIAPYAFGYLQTEPLFLTKSGIYAITAQDITGEKYSQNRSFYLNGSLTKESGMENAVATVYNDMYVLALNNKLYILDGLQATRTDRSDPYSSRQYVGFYCTDVPTVSIWTDENALWIGTHDGRICKFDTDADALESYNDDGKPIYCCWETPDLDGKLFYKNKTFRYFAVRMMTALKTSIKMYSRKLGAWTFIKEDRNVGVLFDFEYIDFERFSFSTDTTEKVAHTKVRVKKVDKARFKVENDSINEPFGLFDLALEYVESGNYKG